MYIALAIVVAELAWIRQLLCDLHVPLTVAPMIYCDNISAIALSSNPVFHSRVKHIEIDYHFARERVIRGDLNVQHVSSKEQFADISTKGLSISLFSHHCSNLMLGSSKHMIEGDLACPPQNKSSKSFDLLLVLKLVIEIMPSSVLQVKRLQSELITPAKPTPRETKFLSYIDNQEKLEALGSSHNVLQRQPFT
ncbi:hypothetical protein DVH24_035594 [Malus domestica]|uniref:Reverse transcriptase Ty1/copia-type domain-containing protein n=1 Tax=Malus domestica TaxID=3750 RepID=A0A498JPD7_MALDO|nr:hypothetical protein DVH24_035594 [Malus domestica]